MRKSLIAIIILLATAVSLASSRSGQKPDTHDKARYYYLEALRRQVEGKEAEAYELYKKAYGIDRSYTEAQSAVGSKRLMMATDSFQSARQLARSLSMMTPFVEKYPGDFFESAYYAYLAAHLDTLIEAIRIYERTDSLFPTKTATLYNLSEAYMANHDLNNAVEALNRYERVEGKSPEISLRKITFFIQAQDTASALKETKDLVDYGPHDPRFRILRGNVFSALSMPDSALQCYLDAESVAPDFGGAKLALAAFYKESGDSVNYDTKTYEALLSEDFDVEQKSSLLAQYLQILINDKSATSRGDYLFSVLREQYPHEPAVLDLAARYSAAKHDLPGAIEQIGYAIDLSPESEDFWGQLMSYQLADDKPQEAVRTFDRAVAHITPSEGLKLLLAQAASMGKDYDRAAATYDDLLKTIAPSLSATDSLSDHGILNKLDYEELMKASDLYGMLGDMFFSAGKKDLAFTSYRNALKFAPDNNLVMNNYAYFLSEDNGDLDLAYDMSKKAVDANPDNPTYLDTLAWILFKQGKYDDALTYQRAAVEKSIENEDISPELYSHLGDILFHCAQPQEALDAWKKALELSPDDTLLKKKVRQKQYFPSNE